VNNRFTYIWHIAKSEEQITIVFPKSAEDKRGRFSLIVKNLEEADHSLTI